jgi:hypothetical protein
MSFKRSLNKVEGLFSARKKIEKEIKEIQELYHHLSTSVKFVRERLDSTPMVVTYMREDLERPNKVRILAHQ